MSARISTTSLLYPVVMEAVSNGLKLAKIGGIEAFIFESYRSRERQAYLYSLGRSNNGKIVTKAVPGFSYHQYGLAVDLVFDANPDKEGVQWTWEGPYNKLGPIMESQGLEWLGRSKTFPELPHFQMSFGIPVKTLNDIYLSGGIEAVWLHIDNVIRKKGIS